MAGNVLRHIFVLAEMALFDPPAPLTDDDEAIVRIGGWLRLADEVVRHEDGHRADRAA